MKNDTQAQQHEKVKTSENDREEPLIQKLTVIQHELSLQNSRRHSFVLGIYRGLGTALGATIIFALATSVLFQLAYTFDVSGKLEDYLHQALSPREFIE